MEEYSYESIKALVQWATDYLKAGEYPKEYQLASGLMIEDRTLFLESSISVATSKWDNLTFRPYITRLFMLQEEISKSAKR